jgi:hypothetical protein
MSLKSYLPWWSKILAKMILSRIPIDYSFWKKVALFEHGEMQHPDYAYGVFMKHFEQAKLNPDFVSLELGPGDSLSSSIISYALGGSSSYLVDIGEFAKKDLQTYQHLVDFLVEKGLPVADLHSANSIEDLLDRCSSHYLTAGIAALKTLKLKLWR